MQIYVHALSALSAHVTAARPSQDTTWGVAET